MKGNGKYITEQNFGDVLKQYVTHIVERLDESELRTMMIEVMCSNFNDTETRVSLEARIIDSHGEDYLQSIATNGETT